SFCHNFSQFVRVVSAVKLLLVNPEDLLAPSEPLAEPTFKKRCFLSVFLNRTLIVFIRLR
ncbi:MAG: hypothetical protein Q5538_03695, partial [Haemophilus parainfluenzae]|nr:hypothetical protein [Haemophilus parainfluenzae]